MEKCWIDIKTKKCIYEPPPDKWGFVYLVVCKHPTYKNFLYVGKKAFTHKSVKRVKTTTSKRKKRVVGTKDSGWLNYYGSSVKLKAIIKELGTEYFDRFVLGYAVSKSDLSLLEVEMQIKYNVLRIDKSFNDWIGCKIFKKWIKETNSN